METRAYRNLKRRDAVIYSLQTKQRNKNGDLVWKVTDYVHEVCLRNCTLKHATANALQRVRTGPREVCQWIQGEVCSNPAISFRNDWKRLVADPKKADGFHDAETGERIDSAKLVLLTNSGAFYV
tara:strand:+ start:181 stop:555 length:375 start_codon:yes stop_codon:yes gene_type:complete